MPAPSLHTNASTTVRQRAVIQAAKASGSLIPSLAAADLATSRSTIYKWASRTEPFDRPSGRPRGRQTFPWTDGLEEAILFFREEGYSAVEIEQALIMDEVSLAPSDTTIHRRLEILGKSRLLVAPRRAAQPFEEVPVGYLHVDLFYLPDIYGGRRFCFVVIERASRMLYTEILPDRTEATVAAAFARAVESYSCRIHTVLSDNGAEFGMRGRGADQPPGIFDALCLARSIKHKRTRPATPQTNGMVERMNGLTKEETKLAEAEEWLRLCPAPSFTEIFEAQRTHTPLPQRQSIPAPVALHLSLWMAFWNEVRPNHSIGWKTPLERMKTLYKNEPSRFLRPPAATIKDLDRLNEVLGGQRLSFHCSYQPLKKAFLSTCL